MAAIQSLHDLLQRVVNKHTANCVIPLVFQRKAHPVKHQAIQQFCVCGQKFELRASHKQPWNAIVAELLGFASVEIIEADRRLQDAHLLALFVGRKRGRMGEIEPLTS